MKKIMLVTLLAAASTTASISFAQAGSRSSGGGRDFAIEYCQYYKTRAMVAGRQARANRGVEKFRRKAISRWVQYSSCLKKNFSPITIRIPNY